VEELQEVRRLRLRIVAMKAFLSTCRFVQLVKKNVIFFAG
jgi:hypothetical protein